MLHYGDATLCMGQLCAAQRLRGDEIHGLDGREAQAAVGPVKRRGALASRGNETYHDFSVGGKDFEYALPTSMLAFCPL